MQEGIGESTIEIKKFTVRSVNIVNIGQYPNISKNMYAQPELGVPHWKCKLSGPNENVGPDII